MQMQASKSSKQILQTQSKCVNERTRANNKLADSLRTYALVQKRLTAKAPSGQKQYVGPSAWEAQQQNIKIHMHLRNFASPALTARKKRLRRRDEAALPATRGWINWTSYLASDYIYI